MGNDTIVEVFGLSRVVHRASPGRLKDPGTGGRVVLRKISRRRDDNRLCKTTHLFRPDDSKFLQRRNF